MEPPPPPSPSTTAEARNAKGKSIQLIDDDREPSKASSSLGFVSFESDCELNEKLIDREPSKASSYLGVSLESDCELNEELIDSEPSEVISLFSVIEPGDPVDEVLKSAVSVIKNSGQIDKEIRNFKSYQSRFNAESKEFLDNVLIDLYMDISNPNDSLFMKAKYANEKEKDLEKACLLYYRVLENRKDPSFDSAVKDLAMVLKRLGKIDEALLMMKDNEQYCSPQSQNSRYNILISLYKDHPNRTAEHIKILEKQLESLENGTTFEGKETKVVKVCKRSIVKAGGKKNIVISLDRERARFLGKIAWLYMQQGNYHTAEQHFSKALSLEPDKNKQCNLAICLMNSGRISEAKSLLQAVTPPSNERERADSHLKSYNRASKMLTEFEHGDTTTED